MHNLVRNGVRGCISAKSGEAWGRGYIGAKPGEMGIGGLRAKHVH